MTWYLGTALHQNRPSLMSLTSLKCLVAEMAPLRHTSKDRDCNEASSIASRPSLRCAVDYRVLYNLRRTHTTLMVRAGKPLYWIAHQLGHVGVTKIDEVYGRWTRTPEEEALDLDAFFLQIMRLPKTALALQGLSNLSQTADTLLAPLPQNAGFSIDFDDFSAPAGSRTRFVGAGTYSERLWRERQGQIIKHFQRAVIPLTPWATHHLGTECPTRRAEN
jgi:hypothetical protein